MRRTTKQQFPPSLEERVRRIEAWIDLWETYDSGWTKYRKSLPAQRKTNPSKKK